MRPELTDAPEGRPRVCLCSVTTHVQNPSQEHQTGTGSLAPDAQTVSYPASLFLYQGMQGTFCVHSIRIRTQGLILAWQMSKTSSHEILELKTVQDELQALTLPLREGMG